MYETDLLLFICFVLLVVYMKGLLKDFAKYRNLFANIKGPKTLPFGLIAYLFTARSGAGECKWPTGSKSLSSCLIKARSKMCQTLFSDRFQILQNLSKKYPNFYSLWFGTKYLFVTDCPDIAQKLLTYPECVEKNFFMELFGFPNGLISIKCEWKWKFPATVKANRIFDRNKILFL